MLGALAGQHAVQISSGKFHSACVTDDGSLNIWGEAGNKLGQGSRAEDLFRPTLVPFPPNVQITQVRTGDTHTVALTLESDVYTWGDGADNKLGHGSTDNVARPLKLIGEQDTITAACRVYHLFSRRNHSGFVKNGELYTFGSGVFGKLGHGNTTEQSVPRHVSSSTKVVQVTANDCHSACVTADGQLYIWGGGICLLLWLQ